MCDLFKLNKFTSHSGLVLDIEIDCNALSDNSLITLAHAGTKRLNRAGIYGSKRIISIPRGGTRFATAMNIVFPFYISGPTLIIDDVLTTGKSMLEAMLSEDNDNVIGLVIFSRGKLPKNVYAVCTYNA